MNLRLCMPRVSGRGAGLGNELVPWARAYVASRVLGARLIAPAFGMNRRRYWRHFGTSRLDWVTHRAMEYALPVVEFGERAYLDHGGGSLSEAIRLHAERNDLLEKGAFLWLTDGLWGGFHHLQEARDFVRETLARSRFAAANLALVRARLAPGKITVGMHVRLGDFIPDSEGRDWRGQFNVSLPLDWYVAIARSLRAQLGEGVQFLVVSDGTAEQLAPLVQSCGAVTTTDLKDADASDLLALAGTDLLVCSVSSYSAWAAFLSDAPYIWFEPNLQVIEGFYSIWGHEPRQRAPYSPTRMAMARYAEGAVTAVPRGVPVGMAGEVPHELASRLGQRAAAGDITNDLVVYGVVPVP